MTPRQELDGAIGAYLKVVPKTVRFEKYDPEGFDNIYAIAFDAAGIGQSRTRAFAYIGYPEGEQKDLPAVVLVHGGGGHAFCDWVKMWTDRGFVAIAMDNTGFFPLGSINTADSENWVWGIDGNLDFYLPGYASVMQTDHFASSAQPCCKQWMYHAVVQTILAANILENDARVDKTKVGITGISWGSIITVLSMRYRGFAFAIAQYCAGYLDQSLTYTGKYCLDYPEYDALWQAEDGFDRINYPVLFLQWTNDLSASVNTNSLCYLATKAVGGELSLLADWNHYHDWSKEIVYHFAICAVCGRQALARACTEPAGRNFSFGYTAPGQVSARVMYTTEVLKAPPETNVWHSAPAQIRDGRISGTVPHQAVLYYVEMTLNTASGSFISATSLVNV